MGLIKKIHTTKDSHDIVLIGELLVDTIQRQNIEQPYTFGGSTANISVNLKNLGCDPLLFAAVGNDAQAQYLIDQLRMYNIDDTHIIQTNRPTSKVVIENEIEEPIPMFYRNADYHISFTPSLQRAISNSKILHFSYWPLSKEPSKSTVLSAIKVAKKHNVTIGFDPNFHVDLVEEDSVTLVELKEIISMVDIIKPSLDDAARLFGHRETPMEYMKEFEALGPSLIILTLGKDGALVSDKGSITKLDSVAKEIIDVTGAGDAFWSGLYAGLLEQETIIDSVKIGLLCSAYALRQSGAITAIPHLNTLQRQLG